MSTTTLARGANLRPVMIVVLVLAALLVAAVGVLYLAGPHTAVPFGLADNGAIVATDGGVLRLFDAQGRPSRVLAEVTGTIPNLSVAPDGSRVAYPVVSGPRAHISVTSIDTGETVQISGPTNVSGDAVGWSPDSRFITFAGTEGPQQRIFIAAADGSSVRALGKDLFPSNVTIADPTWSPDGQSIAFGQVATLSELGRIFVINPDGTGYAPLETRIAIFGDGGALAWAPDPAVRRLLYLIFEDDELQVRLVDLTSGQDVDTSLAFWPAWSPDGSRISGCCATVVETADVLAGTPDPITVFAQPEGNCPDAAAFTGQAICHTATWSPDGTTLISVDIADSALLMAPADGSGSPISIDLENAKGFEASWAWQPIRR